ncbi:MAG TPA: hypothetical protein VI603_19035 [Saprospiraceae bacterium]|nr:hypothetical protein [Saprospiraceae bacterium]
MDLVQTNTDNKTIIMNYIKFSEIWIEEKRFRKPFFSLHKYFKSKTAEIGNEKKKIAYWFLEVNENGKICREIAFDNKNQLIEKAPFGENRGQWVDSNGSLNPLDYENVPISLFNEKWKQEINSVA